MTTNRTARSGWQRLMSGLAMFAAASLTALTLAGCGGDSDSSSDPDVPTVAAPEAPTAFTVTGGENVATLQWSPPAASATAGLPDTYEVYGSTTATTAAALVDPANFVATIPVVTGQTIYDYTALGLEGGNATHYFVVTAKNAGGETPSTVASDSVTGPPVAKTYGNNFSAALIFADDIGITNLRIIGAWTLDPTLIDYNTGLRPLSTEAITVLPSLTVASKIDPLYYEQKSINTWQGEWAKANGVDQEVNAKWGDNLVSASLKSSAKIRIEMVLSKTVTTPLTAYPMKLLSGSGTTELQGTTGVPTPVTTAFVFATNARLKLQKLDASGVPTPVTTAFVFATNARLRLQKLDTAGEPTGAMLIDQALFDPTFPDGLNKLSGEIPVSGNFTYGFVWDPTRVGATAGKYRVTFKLDPASLFGIGGPPNNTFMKTATNGVRVSDTEVYIDIDVK